MLDNISGGMYVSVCVCDQLLTVNDSNYTVDVYALPLVRCHLI